MDLTLKELQELQEENPLFETTPFGRWSITLSDKLVYWDGSNVPSHCEVAWGNTKRGVMGLEHFALDLNQQQVALPKLLITLINYDETWAESAARFNAFIGRELLTYFPVASGQLIKTLLLPNWNYRSSIEENEANYLAEKAELEAAWAAYGKKAGN